MFDLTFNVDDKGVATPLTLEIRQAVIAGWTGRDPVARDKHIAELEALVSQGVIEVTLLGQNVNSYGVEFGDRLAFGKLLRACGDIEGLERVRFTSPHPAAFTDDVIEAMAEKIGRASCRERV